MFTMRGRIIGFGLLVLVGLIVSNFTSADRNAEGEITKSGDVSVVEVQLGDCFDDLTIAEDGSSTVSSLHAVPCSEGHQWQNFYQEELTLDSYSEDEVSQSADSICSSAAERLASNMSAIKIDAFRNANVTISQPTFKSWTVSSDRTVGCLIGSDLDTYYTSVFD